MTQQCSKAKLKINIDSYFIQTIQQCANGRL